VAAPGAKFVVSDHILYCLFLGNFKEIGIGLSGSKASIGKLKECRLTEVGESDF